MMLKMPAVFLALIVLSSHLHANLIQNGSFATGNFGGWTLFTTSNGSLGIRPFPRITSFDVSGTGPTITAEFQVGQITLDPSGSRAGGGIEQVVTTDAALYRFSGDIAALSSIGDPDAGNISVLIDGVIQDTVNFGPVNATRPFMPLLRDTLTFTASLSAGMHGIELLFTRSLPNADLSPDQFITNITLAAVPQVDPDPVPEPATWTILGGSLGALAIASRLARHQSRRRPMPRTSG
jgi:hypothetical protein